MCFGAKKLSEKRKKTIQDIGSSVDLYGTIETCECIRKKSLRKRVSWVKIKYLMKGGEHMKKKKKKKNCTPNIDSTLDLQNVIMCFPRKRSSK